MSTLLFFIFALGRLYGLWCKVEYSSRKLGAMGLYLKREISRGAEKMTCVISRG